MASVPTIEGSPLQSFLRFNDQNGNLLISLNKDGSITLAAGVTLSTGNAVVTSSTPYPSVTEVVLPASGNSTILSFGNPVGTGPYISAQPGGLVIQDLQNGAGDAIAMGLSAQEAEDSQTGILLKTGPGLDTVISSGTDTWRFSATTGFLAGTSSSGIVGTQLQSFTVAGLPGSRPDGTVAWASNGRAVGQGPGSGTGVPVYCRGNLWYVYSTDTQVQS